MKPGQKRALFVGQIVSIILLGIFACAVVGKFINGCIREPEHICAESATLTEFAPLVRDIHDCAANIIPAKLVELSFANGVYCGFQAAKIGGAEEFCDAVTIAYALRSSLEEEGLMPLMYTD